MILNPFRYLFCIFWSISMISLSIILMLLTVNRKLPVIMARTMWAPGILWACGIKLKVEGVGHVDPAQPHIFVSNHCSYLDIPVLFRALPSNLYFIAKKEIKWVPFIGQYMMATGMLFVNRDDRSKAIASLKKAAQLIHNGRSVLMFPEGTRSRDQGIAPFKKGPFHLALQADVSVIPVAVMGTDRVLGPGSNLIHPGEVIVNIGPSISQKGVDLKSLQQASENAVKLLREEA